MRILSERMQLLAGALTGLLLPLLGGKFAVAFIWLGIIWVSLCGAVLYVLAGRFRHFLEKRNIAIGSTASLAEALSSASQIDAKSRILVGALLFALISVLFVAGLITTAMLVLFGHGQ